MCASLSSLLHHQIHIYLWYWVISVHFAQREVLEYLATIAQMNYEQCARLHNEIVRRGVEGVGEIFNPEAFPTFWDTVQDYHEPLEEQLKPSIVDFYKRAVVHPGQDESDSPYENFFYFVSELNNPLEEGYYRSTLDCENQDSREEGWDTDRYLLFYIATDLASHKMGIV